MPSACSDRALDDLVRGHLPLVGHLVRELLGRVPAHVNRDDLISAGLAGLVDAARSYDAGRGTPFQRFAAMRIRGALLDELRGLDWASRSVRQRARQAESVRQEITSALGRVPTNAEVAEALGVAADKVAEVDGEVRRAAVLSLEGFAPGAAEDMIVEIATGPEDLLLYRERIGYLHQAIQALPDRLRTVITGQFLQERPTAEIAEELGVTESRVSQLRTEALGLLRDALNTHLDPDLVAPKPDGCVARRRASYFADVAAMGDLRSRLAMTDLLGLPATASNVS
ncbi:sigma-70 family RNA polymerase sigma factor [Luedemannella helvata]|uniref:FliA/WhiG family RNA polymerase sigma factor n=1 Tax=Luedemannella helvata TaxID=349315 RepID=A0ABP4W6P4_9ACTN